MQSYTFLSPSGPPREGQKNYVFVDEHNRHKRLKVMRACNGCRKRKIKCDAATTNTWPCSACQRLKLVCVPPTVNQDGDSQPDADKGNGADGSAYMEQRVSQPNAISHPLSMPPGSAGGNSHVQGNLMPYNALYQPYVTTPSQPVYSTQPPAIPVTHQAYHQPAFSPQYHRPQQQEQRPQQQHQEQQQQQHQQQQQQQQQQPAPLPTSDSGIFLDPDQSTADGLSEAFGELKIDETGIAPYIRQQRKMTMEPEAFVQDDVESKLPALNTKAGSVVRIPPELMPSDEEAMEYFEVYFTDIHPYVPVVHRQSLYHQWRHDRSSISPLLLEALFACAGRMSDDPAQGAQWLALANRHEPSFMDVPRLSTIQALLLLLKARESNPTKGYFYRSWQTVKTMISMAKDLDIHEHYSLHKDGRTCNLDPVDCLVQTRVWQTLLVVEVMTGGPQGRSDYEVDPNTVDMRPSVDAEEGDPFEIDRSRQFSYFVRNAFNIRSFVEAYHRIKRQTKDWGSSPRFVESNPLFSDFIRLLPPDLQVSYPEDGSPPHLPSHFVGNLHCHYHLGIIMLHRPQLVSSKSFAAGGKWKTHMSLCYSSAKCLCRLQEAILERFGLRGLLFMQRGISFTIYSVLTCTMLHLVAITSPDPEFNSDARDYFTRHMRILEKCAAAWPIPEIQAQIESLRVAFSADTSKPFELKRTFPYGSPSESQASPPPFDGHYNNQYAQTSSPSQQIAFTSHPITPPASARAESNPHSPPVSNLSMMPHATTTQPLTMPLVDENSWDPTRIMTSWDLAFAVNSSEFGPSSPMNANQMVDSMPTQYTIQYPAAGKVMSMDASQAAIREQQPVAQAPVMMTARDWQQSVASVYDPHGIKRRWNYSVDLTHGSSRPG